MREQHGLAGRVQIVLSDPQTGAIVEERWINNHIVLSGRILLAHVFAGKTTVSSLKIVIGTGKKDDKPEDGDNTLVHQLDDQVANAEVLTSFDDGDTKKAKVSVEATFPANKLSGDETQALTEAGIVLMSNGKDILYNRVIFPVINRSAALDMTFRWEVIF